MPVVIFEEISRVNYERLHRNPHQIRPYSRCQNRGPIITGRPTLWVCHSDTNHSVYKASVKWTFCRHDYKQRLDIKAFYSCMHKVNITCTEEKVYFEKYIYILPCVGGGGGGGGLGTVFHLSLPNWCLIIAS